MNHEFDPREVGAARSTEESSAAENLHGAEGEAQPTEAKPGWRELRRMRQAEAVHGSGSAIVVEDVTIEFRPFTERRPSLRRHGFRALKRSHRPVRALDAVTLTIRRGEAFGVMGSNGAGKSTLLRVLAGTLPPDRGKVEVYASQFPTLLSLGIGFNRRISGRRNIYLGGLASGLHKKDIDRVFEDIVEYSELGDAIDRPLETYSSGMRSRLAFSVAVQTRPEILLLDELMSVGDVAFRQKSNATMEGLLSETRTIVMVSHDLERLERFCDRLAWLEKGRVMAVGEPREIVEQYRRFVGVESGQGVDSGEDV
jgi:teichoic acid transport system ATP-binding protein